MTGPKKPTSCPQGHRGNHCRSHPVEVVTMEADMDSVTGTLDKFHLGVSADGRNCVMVFIDEDQRTINCVANFAEFNAFIASLNHAANEMARRRNARGDDEEAGSRFDTLNVAS